MDFIDDKGWVKLYRKSIDSQVFQTEGLWKVWTWCLMKANHKDIWLPIKTGKGLTTVHIKRGQFLFGRKTAAKTLRMKPQTVYNRMLLLRNMRNLDIQSYTHYSIITILNYNFYQDIQNDEETTTWTTNGQPMDTNKNVKNDKNKDRVPSGEILKAYHNTLPELPLVKGWTDQRQKLLVARWNEEPKRQNLEWWNKFFQYVKQSPFLTGHNQREWKPNIDWLLKKDNMLKIIEGNYNSEIRDTTEIEDSGYSGPVERVEAILEKGGVDD